MSDTGTIFLSPHHFKEVLKHLRDGKKIHAIKVVRHNALRRGDAPSAGVGLKEAKLATERLESERLGITRNVSSDAPRIICGPMVHKVVLDYGDEGGPVELDVEGMQLRALTELHSVGLHACAHMLELVEIFKAIEAGKTVQVIDEDGNVELEV